MDLTLGSDPEFMLTKDGQFFSAIPIVPGDKYQRHAIGRHHAYWDNVMAECAVAPASGKAEFIANIRDCLKQYAALVAPYRLTIRASADYPKQELESREAQEIGCDPEFCAYELSHAKPPSEEFQSGTLRTAGGHIHIGSPVAKPLFGLLSIVRMMDLFIGTASIFIDKDPTTKLRKNLYGKAGRFRQPDWGVEYRSLSNFWLASPKVVSFVYDMSEWIVSFVADGRDTQWWRIDTERLNSDEAWAEPDFKPSQCHHCHGYDVDALRRAIDTMDKNLGQTFLEMIGHHLPKPLFDNILQLAADGPYDFYQEWGLN